MKAEERHQIEKNALDQGLSNFVAKAKSGEWLTGRVVFGVVLVLAVGGIFGYWWYASRKHDRVTAQMWAELDSATGSTGLEEFVKTVPDKLAGKVARLQLARIWLGPEGINKLASKNPDEREKAIDSVEKGREQFLKLADEFKDDLTLQAECLDAAAEAELSLVGVRKAGTLDQFRGNVDAAVDLYRQMAKVVGESTPPGEKAKKKADDLAAKKDEVFRVGRQLDESLQRKGTSLDLPRTPGGLTPPAPPPGTGPKAPDGAVIPPATITPPPAPSTPPTAPTPPPAPSVPPPATKK